MLRARLLSALFLLPLVVAAIFYTSPFVFGIILAVLIGVAAWEWSSMVGFTSACPVSRGVYVGVILVSLFFVNMLPIIIPLTIGFICWFWIAAGICSYQKAGRACGFYMPFVRGLVGFLVLVSAWVAMITLKSEATFGSGWLIFVLMIVWGADVGAYFTGRSFGKAALVSRVSPKKTWAGFIGGMLTSILIAGCGGLFFHLSWAAYGLLMLLALITAFFSVVGDLGVSLVKRISGVKDSGQIIPGHGGLLDRLDSIAAATVVFALFALMLRF